MLSDSVCNYYIDIWSYFYMHYTFKSYYLKVNYSFKFTGTYRNGLKKNHESI